MNLTSYYLRIKRYLFNNKISETMYDVTFVFFDKQGFYEGKEGKPVEEVTERPFVGQELMINNPYLSDFNHYEKDENDNPIPPVCYVSSIYEYPNDANKLEIDVSVNPLPVIEWKADHRDRNFELPKY